jgi:hypothetical protein
MQLGCKMKMVSLLNVLAFSYPAVGLDYSVAWIFADFFLKPEFIYVYRQILCTRKWCIFAPGVGR